MLLALVLSGFIFGPHAAETPTDRSTSPPTSTVSHSLFSYALVQSVNYIISALLVIVCGSIRQSMLLSFFEDLFLFIDTSIGLSGCAWRA